MFANFLYFLFALVIYTSADLFAYESAVKTEVFSYTILSVLLFFLTCKVFFRNLQIKSRYMSYEHVDHLTQVHISRLSILGLMFFGVNIHIFKYRHLFDGIELLKAVPTLGAICSLFLFFLYLLIVWSTAFPMKQKCFSNQITRAQFVASNFSFSLPALLPWFIISIVADFLVFLPWEPFREFFNTAAGEAVYIGSFLILISVFAPVLIKRVWNCQPLENGRARQRIELVCQKAGLQYSDILQWKLFGGAMLTAGVMGLIGRFRYILVTPALLASLNEEELDAVIMHEIGHVQKHHMLFYLFFFAGFVACNFVFFEPVLMVLYIIEPVYSVFEKVDIGKDIAHPLLVLVTFLGCLVLYLRFGFGFFMRNFERQADLHVYKYSPDATPLISTFLKIASFSRQSIEKPNWHHFSIGERIRFLEQCQNAPVLIEKHHRKVKSIVTGFAIVILLLFGIGYSINYGSAQQRFGKFIVEQMYYQQLKINPEKTELYTMVGDYFYQRENYRKAIESYQNVLLIDSDNVHSLNNLAWLFATCPDTRFINKKKALEYSKRAVEIKKEAFILDTHAQALFLNDDLEGAVAAAKEAVFLSKNGDEHFKRQLQRFEDELIKRSGLQM